MPSTTPRHPAAAGDPPVRGGCGAIRATVTSTAANVTTSSPYAQVSPARPTITPPTAGPTIWHVCHITWLSASAGDSSPAGTVLGVVAERVDNANPPSPPARPS